MNSVNPMLRLPRSLPNVMRAVGLRVQMPAEWSCRSIVAGVAHVVRGVDAGVACFGDETATD